MADDMLKEGLVTSGHAAVSGAFFCSESFRGTLGESEFLWLAGHGVKVDMVMDLQSLHSLSWNTYRPPGRYS